jgi:hypothetical protein
VQNSSADEEHFNSLGINIAEERLRKYDGASSTERRLGPVNSSTGK